MKQVNMRIRCGVVAMGMAMTAAAAGAAGQCDPADLYGPGQQFATDLRPEFMAIGDLDGDGTPDLAVANRDSNTVSVLLGNGDGTFQPLQNYATESLSFSVAIDDLNGDGTPDLAVANFNSNIVSVLLGNGDGTFQARQNFATGSDPRSVAIGDFDGDGTPDLAVANSGSNSVSVLLNLCEPPQPQIVQQPESVVAGPDPQLVSFSVVATSHLPLSYRWLRDGVPLSDSAQISGALSPTLTIFADAEDVAAYRCVVSNSLGETTSGQAVLAFRPNPCPGDSDGDGQITIFDIITFLNNWNAGCP